MDRDICENRHRGNQLSLLAHKNASPEKRRSLKAKILETARAAGDDGVTAYEIATAMNIKQATTSARFSEMKRDGQLIDTGRRRKTDTDNKAAVYVAALK